MPTDAHPLQSASPFAQIAREQRLQVIVRKGLPPFRQTALELTKALGGEAPDLKKAAKLISTDPTLSSQLLRMCNSPLLGLHSRVISIDHAATLLGPERLRSLALTTSVADFVGKALPESQMTAFWQHSFMTAMLSQFLAKRWKYFEEYQAYIAGLLHDIGEVPEWMLLSEGAAESEDLPSDWVDNPYVEQEYFATDHCKLGGIMARSWGLMPSFLDVLENHHTPELALRDSVLVRIVATADGFLATKVPAPSFSADGQPFEEASQRFVQLGQGLFGDNDWPQVAESLEREYTRILPIAQAGIDVLLGRSDANSAGDSKSEGTGKTVVAPDPDAAATLSKSSSTANSLQTSSSTAQTRATSAPAPASFLSRCRNFFKRLTS